MIYLTINMQILVILILIHIFQKHAAPVQDFETTNMYIASGVSERVEYLIECKVPRK